MRPGSLCTNHSQELSESFSFKICEFECMSANGLANQKLGYIQMLLNIEKKMFKERFQEW